MRVEIFKPILFSLLFVLSLSIASGAPIGEFSRSLEINDQSIEWHEEFELKRNFSEGFVVVPEPQVSANYTGTFTDYTLRVNGEKIDTENYIQASYNEKTINLTTKGENWTRDMTYPGYVECYTEIIRYFPIDSFPFNTCKFWTINPPLPSVEWTTTVKLPKKYIIKDKTDFSYRNFTLKSYSDEYKVNNSTKEFNWCDIEKGEISTGEPQKGTLENGQNTYIFGPYHFNQNSEYADYTDCDAVRRGSVKTGSMLRFSYGPNPMYKAFFFGSILLITLILFKSYQKGLDNLDIGGIIAVLGVQQASTELIGGRPYQFTLYDLTALLVLIPLYWYWKDENEE